VQAGIRACDLAWGRTGKGRKNEQVTRHVSSVTLVTTQSMCVTVDFLFFSLSFLSLSVATHTCSLAGLEASAESQLANSTFSRWHLSRQQSVQRYWTTGRLAREDQVREPRREFWFVFQVLVVLTWAEGFGVLWVK
jgi:hypothetical protein